MVIFSVGHEINPLPNFGHAPSVMLGYKVSYAKLDKATSQWF